MDLVLRIEDPTRWKVLVRDLVGTEAVRPGILPDLVHGRVFDDHTFTSAVQSEFHGGPPFRSGATLNRRLPSGVCRSFSAPRRPCRTPRALQFTCAHVGAFDQDID